MIKLHLDVAFEGDENLDFFGKMLEETKVEVTLNNPRKSGGEWPELIVVGKEQDVRDFAFKHFGSEAEEIMDEYTTIV